MFKFFQSIHTYILYIFSLISYILYIQYILFKVVIKIFKKNASFVLFYGADCILISISTFIFAIHYLY